MTSVIIVTRKNIGGGVKAKKLNEAFAS